MAGKIIDIDMDNINHYEANLEFKTLYHEISDHFIGLESFLKHIHGFVSKTEDKIGKDLEMYSSDFFEYFYAGSYGETFRRSFIIIVCSVSESYIKSYVQMWKDIFNKDLSSLDRKLSILDYLKKADKELFRIELDFTKIQITNLKGLLAIRNSIVHSSGNLEYVPKYSNLIKEMTTKFTSVQLLNNNFISTNEQFCNDALQIAKEFFFYLFKIAIRKFPNYRTDSSDDWDFLKLNLPKVE